MKGYIIIKTEEHSTWGNLGFKLVDTTIYQTKDECLPVLENEIELDKKGWLNCTDQKRKFEINRSGDVTELKVYKSSTRKDLVSTIFYKIETVEI
jgi:hypothetical protein